MHLHPPTVQFNLHILGPLFWTSIMGPSIHCEHQLLGFSGGICDPSSKRPMDTVIFFFLFQNTYTQSCRFPLYQVVSVHGLQSGRLSRPPNLLLLSFGLGNQKTKLAQIIGKMNKELLSPSYKKYMDFTPLILAAGDYLASH